MHYWRKDYFETLKAVASEARAFPELSDYAAFLEEYERGLRESAFKVLDRFISGLEGAPFAVRKRFVSWLLERADEREGRHMLIPHPLHIRIIEPTLLEWTLVEPQCSEPHRWLGGYEHLKQAVELEADDRLARRKLIILILGGVGYATHHLPDGYIGDPYKDLEALKEAEGLAACLSGDEERTEFSAEINENRALIEEYLRSR